MTRRAARRIVINGASGSGKSRLAARLAARLGAAHGLAHHDLDALHWLAGGRKRDEEEARALVADAAHGESWIIEGVYGWLSDIALTRATVLVWLDLSWESCLDGLRRRGLREGMSESDRETLIAWAGA
jgi:adenylate kinase family enzyme